MLSFSTILKSWDIKKNVEILYQNTRWSSRPSPKITLKSVWKVQQESAEKLNTVSVTIIPEVDYRFKDVPSEESQKEEDNRKSHIETFVRAIMSHPNQDTLIK